MSTENQRQPAVRQIPLPTDIAAVARKLAADHGVLEGWCWLDGAVGGGWSYLGAASEARIAGRGREREFLNALRTENGAQESGFFGGWVVSLGYEFGVTLLGLDPAWDEAAPGFALRIDPVLAINEAEGRAELRGSSEATLDLWVQRFGAAVFSNPENCPTPEIKRPNDPKLGTSPGEGHRTVTLANALVGNDGGPSPQWRQSDANYLAQVDRAKGSIADGEAYVLCLTDVANVHGVFDPLELYLTLRAQGPAVRGGVIVSGDRALVSASPERFLSVRGGTVTTHPIKGTRPRGANSEGDQAQIDELATDPKELAENLMIVDLMRNDLSRVCQPGSVRVESFRHVETHPHVHQLVSTVSGTLDAGFGASDVINACFPGGSMTGAPKRRVVEILAALEPGPRGLYSGCFGWLSGRNAELAMTIRGIELRDPEPSSRSFREARVGAGGGITADSDPTAELQEKHLKAAPLLAALSGCSVRLGA